MSEPSPWSIKGVDKETREKMKRMAHQQGMTLADFLDNITSQNTKMVTNNIDDAIRRTEYFSEKHKNDISESMHNNNIANNIVQTKENEIHASSITEKMNNNDDMEKHNDSHNQVTTENKPQIPENKLGELDNKKQEQYIENNTENSKKSSTSKPNQSKAKRTYTRAKGHSSKSKKASEKNVHQISSKMDMFEKLTKKIGIETPAISQLSDQNLTDIIARERHLRDVMRIQLTEMGDMFNNILEEKINEKFQNIFPAIQNHIDSKIEALASNQQDLLKKDELNEALVQLSNYIQEFSLENMKSNTHYIMDIINKNNQTILSQIENIKVMNLHHLSDDMSGGDIATFAAFQDSTEVLFGRMNRIEDLCMHLDDKLAQLNMSNGNASNSEEYFEAIQNNIQDYLGNMTQHLNKAMKPKENENTIRLLQSISDRLIRLEELNQHNPEALQKKNVFLKSDETDADWGEPEKVHNFIKENSTHFDEAHFDEAHFDEAHFDEDAFNEPEINNVNNIGNFTKQGISQSKRLEIGLDNIDDSKKKMPIIDLSNLSKETILIISGVSVGFIALITFLMI